MRKNQLLGPPQETAESEGAEQQQAQGGGRLLSGHPQIRQRGQYLHCYCPSANSAKITTSLSSVLVFFLYVWQVESLPTLQAWGGGGIGGLKKPVGFLIVILTNLFSLYCLSPADCYCTKGFEHCTEYRHFACFTVHEIEFLLSYPPK